jgi:hypothetical protein
MAHPSSHHHGLKMIAEISSKAALNGFWRIASLKNLTEE